MSFQLSQSNGRPLPDHLREVVRSAEEELRHLLRERAVVMKRIGTIRLTLAGLADLFGKSILGDELLALVEGRTAPDRKRGLTRACRTVLMQAEVPLTTRQVCDRLQSRFPEMLERHSAPPASVGTVLGRLQDYAEIRSSLNSAGHRVWIWIADKTSDDAGMLAQPEPALLRDFRVG